MAEAGNRGFATAGQQSGRERAGGPSPSTSHRGRQEESSGGIMGTVGNLVEGAENLASNVASSVASTAGDAWDATRRGAQQAASTVAGAAETAWDSTRGFMSRYPFATLAFGFGLGFLVCMALKSDRS